jgi:D-sedoheptulose 7-phosphate isomerase
MDNYARRFIGEAQEAIAQLDFAVLNDMLRLLLEVRESGGRIFCLGVGGGAANASHAVNDFRKIAGIECYAPSDGVSELTARINDNGWEDCYADWLRVSRFNAQDAIFVFSVGGGDREKNVSMNIVRGLELAQKIGARILGVVGRDGGYTAEVADACIVVPIISTDTITPVVESLQVLVLHLLVTHPMLQVNAMKWEAMAAVV